MTQRRDRRTRRRDPLIDPIRNFIQLERVLAAILVLTPMFLPLRRRRTWRHRCQHQLVPRPGPLRRSSTSRLTVAAMLFVVNGVLKEGHWYNWVRRRAPRPACRVRSRRGVQGSPTSIISDRVLRRQRRRDDLVLEAQATVPSSSPLVVTIAVSIALVAGDRLVHAVLRRSGCRSPSSPPTTSSTRSPTKYVPYTALTKHHASPLITSQNPLQAERHRQRRRASARLHLTWPEAHRRSVHRILQIDAPPLTCPGDQGLSAAAELHRACSGPAKVAPRALGHGRRRVRPPRSRGCALVAVVEAGRHPRRV